MVKAIEYPRVPEALMDKIHVKLCWYRKHGDSLVGEEVLELLTLHDLQDIFDVFIANTHLNFWHVKTRHVRLLQRLTQHRIAINKFIYFVEQKNIH